MSDERDNPLASGCACEGCRCLRRELGGDRHLEDLYGQKLLQRGWSGRTSTAESLYIRGHAGWAQAAARTLLGIAKPSDQPHPAISTHESDVPANKAS